MHIKSVRSNSTDNTGSAVPFSDLKSKGPAVNVWVIRVIYLQLVH